MAASKTPMAGFSPWDSQYVPLPGSARLLPGIFNPAKPAGILYMLPSASPTHDHRRLAEGSMIHSLVLLNSANANRKVP